MGNCSSGSCSTGSCGGQSNESFAEGYDDSDPGLFDVNDAYEDAEVSYLSGEEPCCDGCADGKGCATGCDGNCKGCDGNCPGKVNTPGEGYFPEEYLPRVRRYQNALDYDAVPMQSSERDGEHYQLIMGTDLGDKIMEHAKVVRVDDNILVSIKNPRGEEMMVIRLPFVPVMNFVQSLAMMHGCPQTRPNTVMGYAPIIALLASQVASKKIAEEPANPGEKPKAVPASAMPFDLTSLFKMIPGLSMMAGVFYDRDAGYSQVADIINRKVDMGAILNPKTPCPAGTVETFSCVSSRARMRGDEFGAEKYLPSVGKRFCPPGYNSVRSCVTRKAVVSQRGPFKAKRRFPGGGARLGGDDMGGGCGCGVPCDGIQPNSPYMSKGRVAQRNRVYRATAIRRGANYWDSAPLVNDQASNAFGRRDADVLIPNVGRTHQTLRRVLKRNETMGGGCGC